MNIFNNLLRIILIGVLLYVISLGLKHPHEASYGITDEYVYGTGNAPDMARMEILQQLKKFQYGYSSRDTFNIQYIMDDLFDRDDLLILGTSPKLIFNTWGMAYWHLVDDWMTFGDFTFFMDQAYISVNGNTAWFSTMGYVKFDLSKYLVLPLRFTGVMTYDGQSWKFRQIQYQFDLDISFLLTLLSILGIWFALSLLSLLFKIIRAVNKKRRAEFDPYYDK